MRLKNEQAIDISRKVFMEYMPRDKRGVIVKYDEDTRMDKPYLNTYVPPSWRTKKFTRPCYNPPKLFKKLVYHLFPIEDEREFFYDWLYASLTDRAFTYLILCGAGGVGKNRLKLVMRALHGHQNTVDGKKSTLTERFNSQLSNNTLTWFDELHYNSDMENSMKELQNDSISIERKNFDATRSSKIYSSFVISNNKPRDNFIAFDSRKFVPLVLNTRRLESSMSVEEIDTLTKMVSDTSSPDFNVAFVARIGKWLLKRGSTGRWPLLELKGPMFYKLAHTSMTRWQKKCVMILLEAVEREGSRVVFTDKGFLWSTLEEAHIRKGDKSTTFPDYTTVRYFFDIFLDDVGDKPFITTPVPNSIVNDFYVKNTKKEIRIISDYGLEEIAKGLDNGKEEIPDL